MFIHLNKLTLLCSDVTRTGRNLPSFRLKMDSRPRFFLRSIVDTLLTSLVEVAFNDEASSDVSVEIERLYEASSPETETRAFNLVIPG